MPGPATWSKQHKSTQQDIMQTSRTLSVASALNCTYGMVSLTDIVGGLEQVMVGPTSLVSTVSILVNKRDQCMEPCTTLNT